VSRPKILLDADDFMALHLSALAFGGIGHTELDDATGAPHCKLGHAYEIEWAYRDSNDDRKTGGNLTLNQRLERAGLSIAANDDTLIAAGVALGAKVDFETYVKLLNIDIKE
jgi:hypothetical protein